MKKYLLIGAFVLVFLVFVPTIALATGLSKSEAMDNMSEITKIYYAGSDNLGKAQGSISVGQREEDYAVDGVNHPLCDFSLVVIKFDKHLEEEIDVSLKLNGQESTIKLYFNRVNQTYMADLGYSIGEDAEIEISYDDVKIGFKNISKGFETDYNKAITEATTYLGNKLDKFYSGKAFLAECYLKIIPPAGTLKDNLFWIFSVEGLDGSSENVLVNISTGKVVAG